MNTAELKNVDATVKALNRCLAYDKQRLIVARVGSADHAEYGRFRIVDARRGNVVARDVDLVKLAVCYGHADKSPRPLVSPSHWARYANDPARLAHLRELDRRAISARKGLA